MLRQQWLRLLILNAMADDLEDLQQIFLSVNLDAKRWETTASIDEILPELKALVDTDLVRAYVFTRTESYVRLDPASIDDLKSCWCEMTAEGRRLQDSDWWPFDETTKELLPGRSLSLT